MTMPLVDPYPGAVRPEDATPPLVCGVQEMSQSRGAWGPSTRTRFRTWVRALQGMQKEAFVAQLEPPHAGWRLVSDEGPYLNGTDLAPFPLAFYAAGLLFCSLSRLKACADANGILLAETRASQDTFYTMNGSFLKGDARGGAEPARLSLSMMSDAAREKAAGLVKTALSASPAHATMRTPLRNTFGLRVNGHPAPLPDLPERGRGDAPAQELEFDRIRFAAGASVITKVQSGERVFGVDGGVGTSLAPVQNRRLHVSAEGHIAEDGLMECVVRLLKPIGSTFRFVADREGGDRAPTSFSYLSAGVAFCFHTQLARYAKIIGLNLGQVNVAQDSAFAVEALPIDPSLSASVEPFHTEIFIETTESPEAVCRAVTVGARTCFLHAALAGSFLTELRAELNGSELILP